MDLKGSRTEANLMAAFSGESMATNKYTYFASKAKKGRLSADRRYSLRRLRPTRGSMQRCGTSFLAAGRLHA